MFNTRIDLTGKTFGHLVVLQYSHTYKKKLYWLCRCDCGTEKAIAGRSLASGCTSSCGCGRILHGQTNTNVYSTWKGMIQRCTNPNNWRYADYGGRGIKVCERWREFANFHADMGDKPAGTTLDRINNDGNYEQDNCRWANKQTQENNKRSNKLITIDGKTQTLAQWCKERGSNYNTAKWRLRNNVPPVVAINGSIRLSHIPPTRSAQ